jgi:hypothetical protein
MKRQIRNGKPQPLLKALFKGTDLRGYLEASQTRTLDNYTRGES